MNAGGGLLLACGALAALLGAAACGGREPAPRTGDPAAYEQVILGELALEDGDAEAAAGHFEAALAIDPDDPYLKERLAAARARPTSPPKDDRTSGEGEGEGRR